VKLSLMTDNDLAERMGDTATEAEGARMRRLLTIAGFEDTDEVSDHAWQILLPQAACWYVVGEPPYAPTGYAGIVDGDGCTVCNPSPMGEDNANLIAAAPGLLAALRGLLSEHDALSMATMPPGTDRWPERAAAARAVINMATGHKVLL
jgi:hypothetical protein